jgi:hypothetical protein
VGIGTSSPSDYDGDANSLVIYKSTSTGLSIVTGTTAGGSIFFADGTTGSDKSRGFMTYSHNENSLRLGTDAVERMRITSGGNVSINQTSSYGVLNITGTNVSYGEGIIMNPAPSGYMSVFFRKESATGSSYTNTWAIGKNASSASGGEVLQVLREGLTGGGLYRADSPQIWKTDGVTCFGFTVGINTTSPSTTYKLDVNGSVQATSYFESSDLRLKTNIQELESIDISSITAKIYEKNGKTEIGYIAQDFVGLLDNVVSIRDDGFLDLSYRQIHTAKIAYLENKIKELETKLYN